MRLGLGLHITGLRAGGFSPASLFASGEEGAWYEPSTTTAFASTDDPTPCAVGDTCGFLLDKSQGAGYSGGSFTGLGAEEITNGTFDADATGVTPATWEVNNASASLIKQSDGTALFTSTSFAYARIQAASRPVLPVGVYQVSFDISEWVPGLNNVHVGLGVSGNVVSGSGSYSYLFTSTTEQAYEFQIRPNGGGTGSFKIDNVSVKELPGNHATQATLASRPILRQTGGGVFYLEDDEVDDTLNWTAPADTDYTVSYINTSGTVTTLTGQSLSGSTNVLLDPALVGYVAIDRALTAGETTDLEAYLGGLV